MSILSAQSPDAIQKAIDCLKNGDLVAFPTETVYGLGADARNGHAVAKIFEAKGRPSFNPLILHFADESRIAAYAEMTDQARLLATHFWPGPMTLVLDRKDNCPASDLVSAGLPTIAVRIPAHPTAQKLLETFGAPIAAPSANKSEEISPTSPAHVQHSLGDAVPLILAGGSCKIGLESTIIDMTGSKPVILRPGSITAEDLHTALGEDIGSAENLSDKPLAPGMMKKHYAPSIPLRMNAIDLQPGEALLAFGSDKFMGIKGGGAAKDLPDSMRCNLSERADLYEAAANLFAMMRMLDHTDHTGIAVMEIPDKGIGIAMNDRLRRASA